MDSVEWFVNGEIKMQTAMEQTLAVMQGVLDEAECKARLYETKLQTGVIPVDDLERLTVDVNNITQEIDYLEEIFKMLPPQIASCQKE